MEINSLNLDDSLSDFQEAKAGPKVQPKRKVLGEISLNTGSENRGKLSLKKKRALSEPQISVAVQCGQEMTGIQISGRPLAHSE